MCENEILKTVISRSGNLKAVVFNRGCGAITGFNTQISIINTSEELESEGGNLFIADGTLPLGIHWDSNTSISISGSESSNIYKKEFSFNGITIAYESQEK